MSVKIQRRTAVFEPHMRGAGAGTRGGDKILRIVRRWRRAVRHDDRRLLVAVAKLQPDGPEHRPDLAHQLRSDIGAQRTALFAVVLDRCKTAVEISMREMEARGIVDGADADRLALTIVA